ncbi:hypothetical protein ACN28S_35630 [Cystobacter fuscus]
MSDTGGQRMRKAPSSPPTRQRRCSSGPVPSRARWPASSTTLTGDYTVLEPLGEGGMSVVLAAYDAQLDRHCNALPLWHQKRCSVSSRANPPLCTRLHPIRL